MKRFDLGRQGLDQTIGRLFTDGHSDRDRHAALAGRTKACTHQGIDSLIHVCIGHDDHVVLGAAERLDAFARLRAPLIHVFRDRRGTDKAHGLYRAIVQDGIDRFLVTLDHVQHAVGQSGLMQQ